MYFAIIGDIIESKKIKERDKVQKELNEVLDSINKNYEKEIAANFIITLGDEFQGLLTTADSLLNIIEFIKFKMYPVQIRFGIGIGDINTKINRKMAIGADGPAYYLAREKINEIKVQKKSKMTSYSTIRIRANSNDNISELINCNFALSQFIEDKWTQKQRNLIYEMTFYSKTQKEAAKKLGVSQSSVQRRLKAAGFYEYEAAKRTISKIIKDIWRPNNE